MIDEDAIRRRFEALRDHLDERGRRLFGAAEVRAAGYGGCTGLVLYFPRFVLSRPSGQDDPLWLRPDRPLDHDPLRPRAELEAVLTSR